jgi:hypothetical protein
MGEADCGSLRSDVYVHMQHFISRRSNFVPFRRFLGDVLRKFLQRYYFAALHDTLGSYLRDALWEGSADAVACSSGIGLLVFPLVSPPFICLVVPTSFSCKKLSQCILYIYCFRLVISVGFATIRDR